MSENELSILNWLWGLIVIPIGWCYKINARLTKVETKQDFKIDRLKKLEDKVDILCIEVHKLTGRIEEHLRRG